MKDPVLNASTKVIFAFKKIQSWNDVYTIHSYELKKMICKIVNDGKGIYSI